MEYIPYAVLALAVIVLFWYYHNKTVVTTYYTLHKNIASPLSVLHLSDLHGVVFSHDNIVIKNRIDFEQPDLIVITGDIGGTEGEIDAVAPLLACCSAAAPTVVIPGNHERKHGLLVTLKQACEDAECIYLQNEILTVYVNDQYVNLLGLCETQATYKGFFGALSIKPPVEDFSPLFEKLTKLDGLKLVLSHYPENFKAVGDKSYNQYPFDVMFSGHAHGGQGRLFGYGVIAPGQGFFPKYTAGVHDDRLVISRGLGNSSVPVRVFNRPEVVVVTIE